MDPKPALSQMMLSSWASNIWLFALLKHTRHTLYEDLDLNVLLSFWRTDFEMFWPHFLPSNQWLKNESKKKTYILHHILHHFASVSGLKMFETVHFSSSHMGFVQRLKALQFKNPCNSPWSDSAHSCIGRSPTGTFVDLSGNSGRQVLAFCEVGIIVQPNCMHSLGILGMGVAAAARRISNFRFVLQYLQWQEWGAFQSGSQCPKVPRCAKTLVTLDISWQSACWFFPIEHDSTHSKICYMLFSVALVEVLRTNCLDWIVSNWNQFPGVFLSDLLNRLPVLYKIGQWTSASS